MTFLERLPYTLAMLGIFLVLVLVPLYLLFGGLRSFALKPMQRCYDGIRTLPIKGEGDVLLVYQTYRGFLVWLTIDEHRVYASPADAEKLLGRLLRFNLTWGMLSYGMVLVLLVAIVGYFGQRRSIREQARASAGVNDERKT